MESNHRRCQVVIEKHPNDYAAAMGELRVRGFHIGERIKKGAFGKERTLLWDEYHEIQRLLTDWSKTILPKNITT